MPTFFEISPFFQEFNDRIGRLLAGGFYGDGKITVTNMQHAVIGPQVLTFEHLQLGFVACLIPMVLSIVVFIMELSVRSVSTHVSWMSLFFAIRAYEQRLVIGPERLPEKNTDEVTDEISLESVPSTAVN